MQPMDPAVMITDEAPRFGHKLHLSHSEVDKMNFKVLVTTSASLSFLIPAEQPLELLFFRRMFTRLREQHQLSLRSKEENPPSEPCQLDTMVDDEDILPIQSFQRVMGRLFYLLRDPNLFDGKSYDVNGNGCVGWSEFTSVWKNRQITMLLSTSERIFLTMDDPQSSRLARIVSIITLTTIVVSSFGFILSTLPDLQDRPDDGSAPKPRRIFDAIENICLAIFVLEYFTRLCTCWSVRPELRDTAKLLDLAVGFERIRFISPLERTVRFIFAPTNIVDLAAILPGMISLLVEMCTQEKPSNSGGFVVLRLIRLTRIFRAFRLGKYVESVVVIGRTIKQSTQALYVLGFQLLLGIVIFGSLMYLVEQGDWDIQTRRYMRKMVLPNLDDTTNEKEEILTLSPFRSIPHAFWWAVVTSTGTGYGDIYNFPITSGGYIVAVLCMVWSLVILALPTGVIGGNFSQVWNDFAENRKVEEDRLRLEMVYVAATIQQREPHKMSRCVMLEIWDDDGVTDDEKYLLPMNPDSFMGEVKLDLDLSQDQAVSKELRLRLASNAQICQREVSGFVHVKYEWTPAPLGKLPTSSQNAWENSELYLHGRLRFHVCGASGLHNTDWSHVHARSSPFALLVCYPTSPENETHLQPVVWRTPTEWHTLNPRWDCGDTFTYLWYDHGVASGRPASGKSSPILDPNIIMKPLYSRTRSDILPKTSQDVPIDDEFLRGVSTASEKSDACSTGKHEGLRKSFTMGSAMSRFRYSMSATTSTPDSPPSKSKVKKGLSGNVDAMRLLNKLAHDLPAFTNGLEKLQSDVLNLGQRVDQLQRSASQHFPYEVKASEAQACRVTNVE